MLEEFEFWISWVKVSHPWRRNLASRPSAMFPNWRNHIGKQASESCDAVRDPLPQGYAPQTRWVAGNDYRFRCTHITCRHYRRLTLYRTCHREDLFISLLSQLNSFSAFDESFCDFLEDSTPYAFVSGVVMVVWICAFVQINFSSFHPKIFF